MIDRTLRSFSSRLATARSLPRALVALGALVVVTGACSKSESTAGAGGAEGSTPAAAQPTDGGVVPASLTQPGSGAAPATAPGAAAADAVVDPNTIPAVVAKIDGVDVTKLDLFSRATEARGALAQRGMAPPPPTAAFLRKVLDDIIGNRLLFRALSKEGKAATAAEIDQQLTAIKGQFPSEEAFQQSLSAKGFDLERLRREIAEGITVSRWVQQTVVPSLAVDEAELKKFYEANADKMVEPEKARARHILIGVEGQASAEQRAAARKKAEELRARIQGGADFAALARELSDDKGSGAQGGDLGTFFKGQMVPAFDKVVFELPIGQLSEVVETRFGFHVIEVQERQQATKLTFEAARPRIEQVARQRKLEETVRARVNELAGQAKIEILL